MKAYIFRCTTKTKSEVYERMLLGEELGLWGTIQSIKLDDLLFLYNTSTYEITGPLKPVSEQAKGIDKGAWKGGLPCQIRFEELPETATIPFAKIQHIIKKYRNGIYPEMELSEEQTKEILGIINHVG